MSATNPQARIDADEARAAARRWRRALDRLRDAVRSEALWRPGDHVVLACSAGIDSMVAWDLLAMLRPSLGHTLSAVQVDHGLRDDAVTVGQAMDAMAARTGCHWRRVLAPVASTTAQLEANARLARYQALERAAAQLGGSVIATGHHADDQAETVLMRLARGAGLQAQGAMRSSRGSHVDGADLAASASLGTESETSPAGLPIVRPLLGLGRSDLLALARDRNLCWIDDPHNADPRHERNRLRHEVLPRLEAIRPGASAGIARSARHAAEAAEAIDHWLAIVLDDHGCRLDDASTDAEARAPGLALPTHLWPLRPGPLGVLLAAVAGRLGVEPPSDRATHQVLAWLLRATKGSRTEIRHLDVEHRGEFVAIVRRDVARLQRGTYLDGVGSGHEHPRPPCEADSRDDARGSGGSRGRARSKR